MVMEQELVAAAFQKWKNNATSFEVFDIFRAGYDAAQVSQQPAAEAQELNFSLAIFQQIIEQDRNLAPLKIWNIVADYIERTENRIIDAEFMVLDALRAAPPPQAEGMGEALEQIVGMIDNCAGAPTNADSITHMIRACAIAGLSRLSTAPADRTNAIDD